MATAPGIEPARLPHWRGLSLSDFGNYLSVRAANKAMAPAGLGDFFLAQWQRPATTGALKDQGKQLALPLRAGIDRLPGELTERQAMAPEPIASTPASYRVDGNSTRHRTSAITSR